MESQETGIRILMFAKMALKLGALVRGIAVNIHVRPSFLPVSSVPVSVLIQTTLQ